MTAAEGNALPPLQLIRWEPEYLETLVTEKRDNLVKNCDKVTWFNMWCVTNLEERVGGEEEVN